MLFFKFIPSSARLDGDRSHCLGQSFSRRFLFCGTLEIGERWRCRLHPLATQCVSTSCCNLGTQRADVFDLGGTTRGSITKRIGQIRIGSAKPNQRPQKVGVVIIQQILHRRRVASSGNTDGAISSQCFQDVAHDHAELGQRSHQVSCALEKGLGWAGGLLRTGELQQSLPCLLVPVGK